MEQIQPMLLTECLHIPISSRILGAPPVYMMRHLHLPFQQRSMHSSQTLPHKSSQAPAQISIDNAGN